jgi:predicted nucleic acid-binding protein
VTAKVVDASALASILFSEPTLSAMLARLSGHTLIAPTLLPFELANACVKKARAHPQHSVFFLQSLNGFEALGVDLRPVNSHAAAKLAHHTNLSAYDASYLWLARELNLELVTLDEKLNRAFATP